MRLQFNSHLFILRFLILVIQSLNILLLSVPYLFWFCQQFPVSSIIASIVPLVVFFFISCPTFAYTKSGRALRSNSSNSLYSFSHHLSLVGSVSFLSSLFRLR